MKKILMIAIKAVSLLLLSGNYTWAQLTPEQEDARIKGMVEYNMLRGFTAEPFLEIAAKAGDAESQYYLAELIRLNKSHINPEAQALYEVAAEKGDIYAMLRLADKAEDLCHIMENCPSDTKTPQQWLEHAHLLATERASNGDAEAMYQLF